MLIILIIFQLGITIGYDDWQEHSRKVYQNAQKKGLKVYIWLATAGRVDEMKNPPAPLPISIENNRKMFLDTIKNTIARCLSTTANGIFMYEAAGVEGRNYWETILQGIEQYKNKAGKK